MEFVAVAPAEQPELTSASHLAAEVSVELEADSLEELFAEATRALCDCLTVARDVMPHESRVIELTAQDPDRLLLAWLRELLAVFTTEGVLFCLARVTIERRGTEAVALAAQVWGEPYDAARHALRHPVGEIDPRALKIARRGGRWRTRLSCGAAL